MSKPTPQNTAERALSLAKRAARALGDAEVDRLLTRARDAARAAADCWRDGAGGGDAAEAARDNAKAWDAIADAAHRVLQLRDEADELAECLHPIESRESRFPATTRVSVTPAALTAIEAEADRAGVSVSQVARAALEAGLPRVIKAGIDWRA